MRGLYLVPVIRSTDDFFNLIRNQNASNVNNEILYYYNLMGLDGNDNNLLQVALQKSLAWANKILKLFTDVQDKSWITARVGHQNKDGNTIIHLLCYKLLRLSEGQRKGYIDLLHKILPYADLNIQNIFGETAIHILFLQPQKNLDLIKSLYLKRKFNLDLQDYKGNTYLHYAGISGCLSSERFLILNEAKNRIKNREGKTPLDEVYESGGQASGIADEKFLFLAAPREISENLEKLLPLITLIVQLSFSEKEESRLQQLPEDILFIISNYVAGKKYGRVLYREFLPILTKQTHPSTDEEKGEVVYRKLAFQQKSAGG